MARRLVFSLMFLLFVAVPGLWAAETVRVTATQVEVQREASATGGVLGTATKGTVFQVLGRVGGWVNVAYPIGNGAFYNGYIPAVFCEDARGAAPSGAQAAPPVSRPAPAPAPVPVAPAPQPQAAPVAPPPQTYTPPPPAPRAPEQALVVADGPQREGFWIGFGLGYGSAAASADCDDCSGDREGSFTGFLKLGGTLNPQVLLGVESNAWAKNEDIGFGLNATTVLGAVSGTVTVYPVVNSGFFLKGGVGLSYVSSETYASGVTISLDKTGWGFIAGLGYDLRVGRNISITPSFNYYYGKPGDISAGGYEIPGWSQNVLDISLGITFH